MHYLDCGGGLGVDYDGSQTNFHSSVNYTLQEYAADIVSQIAEACDAKHVPHPDIVTESGRALVAHHSVLVFNVLGTNEMLVGGMPEHVSESEHRIIQSLFETWQSVSRKNFQEAYHDALQLKEEATTAFNLGVLDLKARARAEQLFYATVEKILKIVREIEYVPDDLEGLERQVSDTYYCNFSLFQSVPDHWAVRQLFPTMPIHRLDRPPSRRGGAGRPHLRQRRQDGPVHRPPRREALPRAAPAERRAVPHRQLPDRRLPGDPGRPAQPLRRHRRRPRPPGRRRLLPRGARRRGRLGGRGPVLRPVLKQDLIARVRRATELALREGRLTPAESGRLMRRYEEAIAGVYVPDRRRLTRR
jgi:arginine decarboxylase